MRWSTKISQFALENIDLSEGCIFSVWVPRKRISIEALNGSLPRWRGTRLHPDLHGRRVQYRPRSFEGVSLVRIFYSSTPSKGVCTNMTYVQRTILFYDIYYVYAR